MKKTIDGLEFDVTPFRALEALRLKSYLVRTLGPALAEAVDVFRASGVGLADTAINGDKLCAVVEKLTASLDEDAFVALVKRMLTFVVVRGTDENGKQFVTQFSENFEVAFNRIFAGRLFTIYPVMLLVLQANYPDFFGKAAVFYYEGQWQCADYIGGNGVGSVITPVVKKMAA